MKFKIAITLPSVAEITAGLTPEIHAPYLHAQQAVVAAEGVLDRRRAELAALERRVVALPDEIQKGHTSASVLRETLNQRDACALLIPPAEADLAKARERVAVETKAAKPVIDREFYKRAEVLERAAAEVTPLLTELGELASALVGTRGIFGARSTLDWPDSPAAGLAAAARGFAASAPPAAGDGSVKS